LPGGSGRGFHRKALALVSTNTKKSPIKELANSPPKKKGGKRGRERRLYPFLAIGAQKKGEKEGQKGVFRAGPAVESIYYPKKKNVDGELRGKHDREKRGGKEQTIPIRVREHPSRRERRREFLGPV